MAAFPDLRLIARACYCEENEASEHPMRVARALLGEQLSRLPITETLLRTRLNLPDLKGSLEPVEQVCREQLTAKALGTGESVRSDDGWLLSSPLVAGRIVTIDEVLYFRLDEHRTPEGFERDFRIDLAFDREGRLDLSLSLTQLRSAPRPSLYAPAVLGAILARHRAFDADTQISSSVEHILSADDFANAIFDTRRDLPLLALSQPLGLSSAEIAGLAGRLAGAVRVLVLDDVEVSWGVTHTYGKEWSAFNGAIRVYSAGLVAPDPVGLRWGRLFLRSTLQEQLELDRGATLDAIVEAALAPSTFSFADEPVPSLDAALAERRKKRRKHVAAKPEAPLPAPEISLLPRPEEREPELPAKELETTVAWEAVAGSRLDEIGDLEAELASARTEIENLQRANSVLRNERDAFEQLGIEAEAKVKEVESKLESLKTVDSASAFSGLTDAWSVWIGEVVALARQASQDSVDLSELREDALASRAKADALELALGQRVQNGAPVVEPKLGDLPAFEAYLAQRYPGIFVLSPNGRRTFKDLIYEDPARFFQVIDLLGTTYVRAQRARGSLSEFEQRAEQLNLKSTPSCTPHTFNGELGQYHRVPLSDGIAQMYELRDRGLTFVRQHFLYVGFAYDPEARKVVLNAFRHPPTPSDRT